MSEGASVLGLCEHRTPVVLLVEDEVLVRLTTAEILREAGYDVLEAVDASEALAIFETGHPLDVVLTDIRMPGDMDGIGLTASLRARRPNLPVVIVSSHVGCGVQHKADRFLAKPYTVKNLFKIIDEVMRATSTLTLSGSAEGPLRVETPNRPADLLQI